MIRASICGVLSEGASAGPSEASPRNRLRGRSPRSNRNIQRWVVRILIRCSPPDVEVFRFRAPALPAQRILGGRFGRGAKPPAEWNVQGVRLACGPRAPPCSWTLLIALARAFLRQAPRARRGCESQHRCVSEESRQQEERSDMTLTQRPIVARSMISASLASLGFPAGVAAQGVAAMARG